MINWTVPTLAMGVAAMVGASLDARFVRTTAWSKRRRVVAAAAPVPLLMLLATAGGIAWELFKPRTGGEMTDLAVAVILTVGGLFFLLTAMAGLAGALMAERKRSA